MPLDCTNSDGAYGLIDEGILPLDSCSIFTTQTALIYLAEVICSGITTTSNNLRCVPDSEPTANFNGFFDGSTPDTYAVVYRLDSPNPTLWITCNGGTNWTQIAFNNEFRSIDTSVTSPSDANLNALFTSGVPNTNALVVDTNTGSFYATVNGANWNMVGSQTEFRTIDSSDCATTFVDPNNPTDSELNDLFPDSTPSQSAFVYNPCNDTFYYTFDGATWNSISISTCGLTSATYASVVILAGASDLSINCLYEITDVVNLATGDLAGSTYIFQAIDTDFINASGYVLAPTGETFKAIYDVNTNNVVRLWDDAGNDVAGSSNIEEFLWFNSDWHGNTINEESVLLAFSVGALAGSNFFSNQVYDSDITINASGGTIRNNDFRGATITLSGGWTGSINQCSISGTVIGSGASGLALSDSKILTGATVTLGVAGEIEGLYIDEGSTFDTSGSNNIRSHSDTIKYFSDVDYTNCDGFISRDNVYTGQVSVDFSGCLTGALAVSNIVKQGSTINGAGFLGSFSSNTLVRNSTVNIASVYAILDSNDLRKLSYITLNGMTTLDNRIISNNFLSDSSYIENAVDQYNDLTIDNNNLREEAFIVFDEADDLNVSNCNLIDGNINANESIGCVVNSCIISQDSSIEVETCSDLTIRNFEAKANSFIALTGASSASGGVPAVMWGWIAHTKSIINAGAATLLTNFNGVRAINNSNIALGSSSPSSLSNLVAENNSSITFSNVAVTGSMNNIIAQNTGTITGNSNQGTLANITVRNGYSLTANKNVGFSTTNSIYALTGASAVAAGADEVDIAIND
jgi:hypothetical protein